MKGYGGETRPFDFMKETKPIELLSPAGDMDTLRAVIHAGADAVYLGMRQFGARAYAKNFETEELLEAIAYAHLWKVKIYLTVNTCYKESELPELIRMLRPIYEAGLDAALVQDFGAFQLLRHCFPGLPLHASTQMAVSGEDGAFLMHHLGAERVVLARELSLDEIRGIAKAVPIELECFIHGALCYSYSGLCLMSSILGGRSGNRGRCAGTCRLPFSVDGGETNYPLSLKDLCAIDFLPELRDAGVRSLKIEGRMKSAEYASGVTSIYRKYLDQMENSNTDQFSVAEEDRKALLDLGSRSGFTKGYFESHNGPEMVSLKSGSHSRVSEASLTERYGHFLGKQLFPVKGAARIHKGESISLTITLGETKVTASGSLPLDAKSHPLTRENVEEKLRKTGETIFCFEELSIDLEEGLFLPVRSLNELRRAAFDLLKAELQKKDQRTDAREIPEPKEDIPPGKASPELIAHLMKPELLPVLLSAGEIKTIILDSFLYNRERFLTDLKAHIEQIHGVGKKARFALPYVFRKDTASFYASVWEELLSLSPDELLVRTADEIGFLLRHPFDRERVVLDERLYVWSRETRSFFKELGFHRFTLPLELKEGELAAVSDPDAELILYGRIPLMITAGCIHKNTSGCDKKKSTHTLKDRIGKEFPVFNDCTECLNLIYNPDILWLDPASREVKRIAPGALRYSFTLETPEETERILKGIRSETASYTRGHLRRGIE